METLSKNKTGNKNGMGWIRPEKRLAIYLRDGLACLYCASSIEDGAKLTLDHLVCRIRGGSNHEINLITACMRCNSARGDGSWIVYARFVGGEALVKRILNCVRRKLDIAAARALMDLRGGFLPALKSAGAPQVLSA